MVWMHRGKCITDVPKDLLASSHLKCCGIILHNKRGPLDSFAIDGGAGFGVEVSYRYLRSRGRVALQKVNRGKNAGAFSAMTHRVPVLDTVYRDLQVLPRDRLVDQRNQAGCPRGRK
jgi:hypothetical protein